MAHILKIIKKILASKLLLAITILILLGGGYWGYKAFFGASAAVRYMSAQVQKGTLIVSVSGSGQVSVSNQIDIKPKASGDIVYVGVKNGQEVKAGALIAQLDTTDAQKAVRDAEANLESAKLSLEKLKQPADTLSILQAENSLAQAKESKQEAEDDLTKAYDDGFNTIANVFLDLPTIMTGLHDVLFNSDFSTNQENFSYYADAVKSYDNKALQYKDDAYSGYQTAQVAYDKNFSDYKIVTRYSDTAQIESLLDETYNTTKSIAEAIKNANNLIQFYIDKLTERNLKHNSRADTALTSLNTYTGKTNTYLLDLLSIQNTIKNSRDTIVNADRSIAEKTESLAKLKAGADALDIQSSELTVKQRENALLDAKEKLADYFVRAPFDGVIAKVNANKGDSVSSASVLATLITRQKLAEISLNEVDVAKVKVGQKATLTFDAVPDLTITGQVAEVDAVGTVSQGVVTYTVKISFDTQDDRVKPGMSVSAAIVTEAKPNVLLVPNSAIKSQGDMAYVEIFAGETQAPRRQTVQIGLSNDTMTEVTNGLKEGDQVVTQTITQTAQSQSQQNTGLRIPGLTGGGGGGGGFRGSGGTGR
jgi:HlyD family secretion protein